MPKKRTPGRARPHSVEQELIMDYTNQHGALRQVGELDDNRQRLLAAKTELDDATKRYQDAKQAYDQAYTAFKPLCSRVAFPHVLPDDKT